MSIYFIHYKKVTTPYHVSPKKGFAYAEMFPTLEAAQERIIELKNDKQFYSVSTNPNVINNEGVRVNLGPWEEGKAIHSLTFIFSDK